MSRHIFLAIKNLLAQIALIAGPLVRHDVSLTARSGHFALSTNVAAENVFLAMSSQVTFEVIFLMKFSTANVAWKGEFWAVGVISVVVILEGLTGA